MGTLGSLFTIGAAQSRKLRLLQALVLCVAALCAFAPALHGLWLWDDDILILNNVALRSPHGLWTLWFAPPGPDYWPLTGSLNWMEWQVWRDNSLGYHLVNLALHVLNGFFLWRLFERLGLRWGWFGALLFVVHPLTVESVAWISETKNTLSLVCYLLAFHAFLDGETGSGSWGRLRALGWYLAGLFAKSSTIMLPCVFILYRVWKRGRAVRRDFLEFAPFFILALVFAVVTFLFQKHSHVINGDVAQMRANPFFPPLQAALALLFYFGKFFTPIGLLPIYPRWPNDGPFFLHGIVALLFLCGIALCLWREQRQGRGVAFFWLGFFALNLLPVLGLVEMSFMNISWVADHFVYLPMIGLVGLTVTGLEFFFDRLTQKKRWGLMALAGLLVVILTLLSHRDAKTFRSLDTFWAFVLQTNPGAKETYNDLGIAAFQLGHMDEAIAQFRTAIAIYPDYYQSHDNLGVTLLRTGHRSEAKAEFETALRINPAFKPARDNLERMSREKP